MCTIYKKGFTLIELLVVISIVALLSSVVMAGLSDAKMKGRDAGKVRMLAEIRSAIQMYFSDKGTYPASLPELIAPTPYIKSVTSPNVTIIYKGTNGPKGTGSLCGTSPCSGYLMGVVLEKSDNKVLLSDTDATSTVSFEGKSVNCVNAGVTDLCYDIVQ